MAYSVELTEIAEADLSAIKPYYRKPLVDAMSQWLIHTPTQISRSRIKRLRLLESPAYRLRVGEYRVYYDVDESEQTETVLRILDKKQSLRYLGGEA